MELAKTLTGLMGPHQRFLLTEQLQHLAMLVAQIARLDQEIAQRLAPFVPLADRLLTIPGVGRRTADVILADIGPTVTPFRTAAALAKWIGLVPGHNESAGKRLSGRTVPGDRALRAVLVDAAYAAGRTTATYLGAQYRRAARVKGAKRAAIIVAHSIAVAIWHILGHDQVYVDLGGAYFDRRDREQVTQHAVKRLEALGYTVHLTQAAS